MHGQQMQQRRLEQRDHLAALGAFALKSGDLDGLLGEACRLVAAGLGVRFCKFLEPRPEGSFLVRAGIGWREGVVGHAKLEGDGRSPAGHALKTGQPVLSARLSEENRFRTPPLLIEHGVESAMNVIVRGERDVFGVLEADSTRAGVLDPEDLSFMQAAANLLGLAMERERREAKLREAVEARELLLREADHRIKNSLQLVASLLSMQRSRISAGEAAAVLDDAIARVQAVAHAHRAFQQSSDLRRVPFGEVLRQICGHVGRFNAAITIECRTEGDLELDSERAIPLGLIVSEWLTNAMQHAYPPGQEGSVRAIAIGDDSGLTIQISDDGAGLPDTPAAQQQSLGMTIVRALVRQIGAMQQIESAPGRGTAVTLRLAREAGGAAP